MPVQDIDRLPIREAGNRQRQEVETEKPTVCAVGFSVSKIYSPLVRARAARRSLLRLATRCLPHLPMGSRVLLQRQ
jgi:hypothetical protein